VKYLLDTNTCIYVIKKKPASVVQRLRSQRTEDVAVSTVTVAELDYGVEKSQHQDRNRVALLQFLVPLEILDFDQYAAGHYGEIRARLRKAGTPIGPLDMLIGAQARAHGLILVTNNTHEFSRVEGLQIANWVE
jgi:tRNA(fMet)-specific endonuclease VapC